MKKYFVVVALFALPIILYLFFASGVNNFARLPVLTDEVQQLEGFSGLEGEDFSLQDKITILGFPGKQPLENLTGAYHLAEKIYKPYHEFQDLQFVYILPTGSEEEAIEMKEKLSGVVEMGKWKFVVGDENTVRQLFSELQTDLALKEDLSSPYVFIVDKDARLRGRDDDEDQGMLYGYDAESVSVLSNKMKDDVKVILAEYRLALKKYKSDEV